MQSFFHRLFGCCYLFLFHLYIAFVPLEGSGHIHLEFRRFSLNTDDNIMDVGKFGEGVYGHGNEKRFAGGTFDIIQLFAEST